mmetsp:Transcript_75765/g.149765  ORF Transcript_75765/g.149765 Transcript_75765/m.149765 type:complete len:1208 (+) Transcript_75765:93-3716(+)
MVAIAHSIPLLVDSVKQDLNSVIELGRQQMLDGSYEVAIQCFTEALSLKPGFMQALVSRGFCYLTVGEEGKAQRDFGEVISKDSGFNRNIYVLIALCFKRSGDYQLAIRYLTHCIVQFAGFKPALLARGELCLKVKDYDRARSDFRQVLNDDPSHIVARRGLGDALRGQGHLRDALRQYTRVVEAAHAKLTKWQAPVDTGGSSSSTSPGPMATEQSGSEQADDTEPPKEASAALHDGQMGSVSELRAFLVDILQRRALQQRLMGNPAGAGHDFLEALDVDPSCGLAMFWYGKVLLEQNRHKEASAFFQASLKHHKETRAEAHALLGALELETWPASAASIATALHHLEEAIRLRPSSQPIRITLWICKAAAALHQKPGTPSPGQEALSHLSRALSALNQMKSTGSTTSARTWEGSAHLAGAGGQPSCGPAASPRFHVAGKGSAAASALSQQVARTAEEVCGSSSRNWVNRCQLLAQGDDLKLALECKTYLHLVARDAHQQAADTPRVLHVLRALAYCDVGQWLEAVAECRKALTMDHPENANVQYVLHVAGGVMRSKRSELDTAIGCFTKAIRTRPTSMEARLHRAIALASAAWGKDSEDLMSAPVPENSRAEQLLQDALQDLHTVKQSECAAGGEIPSEVWHLSAACLCSLRLPADALDVLKDCAQQFFAENPPGRSADAKVELRQHALKAEALLSLGRHQEAVDACSALLSQGDAGNQAAARLMRGCCWDRMGRTEEAFEDYREALLAAPDRPDVHEANGNLFLQHRRFQEAFMAFENAGKLGESMAPRLAYKRALAQLALGDMYGAQKDVQRSLRVSPTLAVAARARDGLSALQMILEGNYRHAHILLNQMIHSEAPDTTAVEKRLPRLFQRFECVLYRAMCLFFMGDTAAAIADFQFSLDLARKASSIATAEFEASSDLAAAQTDMKPPVPASRASNRVGRTGSPQRRKEPHETTLERATTSIGGSRQLDVTLLPEAFSRDGLAGFECEVLYNVVLCHLLAGDYQAAPAVCEQLLDEHAASLEALGPPAQSLVWFLYGACCLAADAAHEDVARQAFMQSYAYDPSYVDDFLRRHGQKHEPRSAIPVPWFKSKVQAGSGRRRSATTTPHGGCIMRPASIHSTPRPPEVCDASKEAVCFLRHDRLMFTSLLPPCRLQVGDAVIWSRLSICWPHVRPADGAMPTSLARLDLLEHRGMPTMPPNTKE